MNYDLVFALILYALIFVFFLLRREKFKVQSKIVLMYPTKIGIKLMDRISKIRPGLLKALGYVGVVLGFIGMVFIFYTLAQGAYQTIFVPKAPPTIAPVLPGISIPGVPALTFWHWIIAILITASVHEFSHGVFARLFQIKIKSSGFALFGPILAAFVEPEEETLKKIAPRKQLAIFAAGPFANIVLGVIFLLVLNFVTGPLQISVMEPQGIIVNEVKEGYPADTVGLKPPFIIKSINNEETLSITNFTKAVSDLKPDQQISLGTDKGTYTLTTSKNPENESKGFMGVGSFEQKIGVKNSIKSVYGESIPKSIIWVNLLVLWLFVINIGLGLFNLLPLGPVDGGRMFYVAALSIFKDEKKAMKIWGLITFICLFLIGINLFPWFIKLFRFIVSFF